jgi:uncharacterized protein YkwD
MPATDLEQLALELINEARLDPMASAQRYISSYSPLIAAQANIQNAFSYFHVDGAALLSAFTNLQPVQPLAWNDSLAAAARTHDNTMIALNQQTHQGAGEADPGTRMSNAGYAPAHSFGWGENVFATGQDSLQIIAGFMVDWGSGPGGMQSPAGHRQNIMSSSYREAGIGIVPTAQQSNVGPLAVTEDLASRSSTGAFILGVAYNDNDHNHFYSLGEGVGSLTIAAPGAVAAASAASGGYSLFTAQVGLQHISFSGGGLSSAVDFATTLSNGENAKIDIVDGHTLLTSVSGTVTGPISLIEGLGLSGLSLSGDGHAQSFVGTPGNDTIDGAAGADTVIFSAARAAYTVTDLGHGSVAVAGPDGSDTLLNVEFLQFADQTMAWPPTTSPAAAASHDFNGDGFSDVLWRNNSTGDAGYSDVTHGNGWHGLGVSSPAYSVAGTGDFNGDGFSDVLWRNNASGDAGYSDLHGGNAWHGLGGSSTAYGIVGVGDFNGDGFSDLLWRNNASGDTGSTDLHNGGAWSGLGASSTAYHVAGVGDFNGDGFSDILWRNDGSGDTGATDLHHGGAWIGLGASSTAYKVAGIGDFNGDGFDDVLWRNDASGDAGYTDIHAGNAWHGLGASSTAYTVAAVGDYNADGFSDILYRNTTTGDTGYSDLHNNQWHGLGAAATDYLVVA